ncbi:MAG: DUF255 domain-containing protein [Actinobacteria bacterium]|nr:DUF255 domain-containing protein [Actinomycetota bacterium]
MEDKQKKDSDQVFRFSPRPNRAREINWREWSEDAFKQSEYQGKPVLLAISASWCHWCHVMDETCYSDESVISLINENFIPVRVDSDRRPEINSRYNQGGLPTVAFLTPDGESVGGTTYLSPDQLSCLLADFSDLYVNNREKVVEAVRQIRQELDLEVAASGSEPDESVAANVLRMIAYSYDEESGGFGIEPKFPYPSALNFLLMTLADGYIEAVANLLTASLDAMAAGGLYDRVEGGFFRYSTARDWSTPHYEKLLEDNAALLAVYADAFLLTEEPGYESVARDIYRYLDSVLLDRETGAFGGSQEADEHYYLLDAGGRARTTAPRVDFTVYFSANAVAASALLRAFQVFGDPEFRDLALGALEFIFNRMWTQPGGPSHYFNGNAFAPGLLVDAARLVPACIDAFESGAGEVWLDRAVSTASWVLANLEDKERGGFFDTNLPLGPSGFFAKREKPIVENSLAASALVRLAQTTGQPRFGDSARGALSCYSDSYKEKGIFAADYACAVQRMLEPPVRVTIIGPPAANPTLEMIKAAHRARLPFRSVEILDPDIHGEELEVTGYGYRDRPMAFICIGSTCQPAAMDPAELTKRLEKGRREQRNQ